MFEYKRANNDQQDHTLVKALHKCNTLYKKEEYGVVLVEAGCCSVNGMDGWRV